MVITAVSKTAFPSSSLGVPAKVLLCIPINPRILNLHMDQPNNPNEEVTVINTAPSNNSGGDNGYGFLLWVVVLGLIGVIFFVYALPYIRGLSNLSGVQVNVPDSIDINVKQSK